MSPSLSLCLCLCLSLSLSLPFSLSVLKIQIAFVLLCFITAEFVCCEVLDSNSFCFAFKSYFILPQLLHTYFILSVAVFDMRDRFVLKKRKKRKKEKKPTCA